MKSLTTWGVRSVTLLLSVALTLIACQATPQTENTPTAVPATPTAVPPTASPTPEPTATATATATATPTATATWTAVPPTATPEPTATPVPTISTARRLRMTYDIEHPTVLGTQTLVDKLWLPLPNGDGDGTRDVLLIEAYPQGYEVLDIGEANRALYWADVPESCQPTDCHFGATFEVTLERPMYTIPWNDRTPYDTESQLFQTYTQPQRGIQSDSAELRDLAQRIVGDETSPYKRVLMIQAWIQSNIQYPDLGSTYPDDALQCIQAGTGDCAGQSKVFVALCRALGIPARTVSGLRPFERDIGRLEQFGPRVAWFERTLDVHVWCEVYFEGFGWVQCEPDMSGFGIDKERLITKRGPFSFPGGLCQQATYFHLPLAVHENWCGQSVGWEVIIETQAIE